VGRKTIRNFVRFESEPRHLPGDATPLGVMSYEAVNGRARAERTSGFSSRDYRDDAQGSATASPAEGPTARPYATSRTGTTTVAEVDQVAVGLPRRLGRNLMRQLSGGRQLGWRVVSTAIVASSCVMTTASPCPAQGPTGRQRIVVQDKGFTLVQEGGDLVVVRGRRRLILDRGLDSEPASSYSTPLPLALKAGRHWILRYLTDMWKVRCIDETGRNVWSVTREGFWGPPPPVRTSSRWALVGPSDYPRFKGPEWPATREDRKVDYRLYRRSLPTVLVSMRDGKKVWERPTVDVGAPLHVEGDRLWVLRETNTRAVWLGGKTRNIKLELRRLPDLALRRAWRVPQMGLPSRLAASVSTSQFHWLDPIAKRENGKVKLWFNDPGEPWTAQVTLAPDLPTISLNGKKIGATRIR